MYTFENSFPIYKGISAIIAIIATRKMYSLTALTVGIMGSSSISFGASKLDATVPTIKPEPHQERFLEMHHSFLERAKKGPVGLLFLGDSIIFQWTRHPEIWEPYYAQYDPANFGVAGDATQQVLWRIENGELDHILPKVVVLLIGTNNSGSHSADEIIAANTKIVREILERLPQTKVLLLGIFPRGPRLFNENGIPRDDGVTRMAVIEKVNEGLALLDNGENVRFLNIGSVFFGPDGKIPEDVMYDQLHLTKMGYQLWAESMQPLLSEMMESE